MAERLANIWRLTVNERKFVENVLQSELRVDGRGLYDYRKLTIKFGKWLGLVGKFRPKKLFANIKADLTNAEEWDLQVVKDTAKQAPKQVDVYSFVLLASFFNTSP